jgi:hypothetical protein
VPGGAAVCERAHGAPSRGVRGRAGAAPGLILYGSRSLQTR